MGGSRLAKRRLTGSGPIFTLFYDVSEDAPEGECRNLYLQDVKIAEKTYSLNLSNSNVFNECTNKVGESLLSETAQFCFYEAPPTTTTTIPVSTTTTTICKILKIYGEGSEEVKVLRSLRDDVLSQTPEGREIIRLYYQWSPAIIKAMEEDEEFKEWVKEMIDGVLLLMME